MKLCDCFEVRYCLHLNNLNLVSKHKIVIHQDRLSRNKINIMVSTVKEAVVLDEWQEFAVSQGGDEFKDP